MGSGYVDLLGSSFSDIAEYIEAHHNLIFGEGIENG